MSVVDLSDVLAPLRREHPCTGVTADWCPNHGQCECADREVAMDDGGCPLHNSNSPHAEGAVER
jgi:hypothetical protein